MEVNKMAGLKLPQNVVDASVFVDGVGFAGVTESIKLPEIEELMESSKAGGFERDHGTGVFKKLEFEIAVNEFNAVIYSSVAAGLASGAGINLTVKGSLVQDGKKTPFVATIQGKSSISLDGLGGEKAKTTLKGTAERFSFELDGKQLCLMDSRNMIAQIGDVDYLAELRTHIL
jgi:P2 family phage contractile tail tube protein